MSDINKLLQEAGRSQVSHQAPDDVQAEDSVAEASAGGDDIDADARAREPGSIAHDRGRSDAANALRFINDYHSELLFVPPWKRWLSWDGMRWKDDSGIGAEQRVKRYADSLWAEIPKIVRNLDSKEAAKVITFVKASNSANKIRDMMVLAKSDPRVVCEIEELNSDATLLNCPNGTVDLVTGELRRHSPADRITQLCGAVYDRSANCPEWEKTLRLIFDDNDELIQFVQRLLGYSISGETGEHILPIAFGSGANGKSTIWNTVSDLLGDYAYLANDSLLLGLKDNHPADKAALYQKRFVPISEPEKNSRLREARVKELTGDRKITARRMKENFWSFERTHTFWLSTNHLPQIEGVDEGIWRRVKLIPFNVDLRKATKEKKDFDKWLVQNEGPGILAWLVRGYMDYREQGLRDPQQVVDASEVYRKDSDELGKFIAEHCAVGLEESVLASELFEAYRRDFNGAWTQKSFGEAMGKRFKKEKPNGGKYRKKWVYHGLSLNGTSRSEANEAPGN